MSRQKRQEKLLEIISEQAVETQQALTEALRAAGFDVTQATVSRDIQELGLVKSSKVGGKSCYMKPLDPKLVKLKSLFHQSVISIESVNNLIVIKTINAGANSACSLIDSLDLPEIMGSVAGDDTILIVVRNEKFVKKVIKKFSDLRE